MNRITCVKQLTLAVLSPRADQYAEAIRNDLPPDCTMHLATSSAEFLALGVDPKIVLGNPKLIADVIDSLSALRWVQSTWAGVRPLTTHDRRDYDLTGVRGIFGQSMAEYVAGHLLAHELKLARRLAAQAECTWLPESSGTLQGKNMLVLGTGEIGSAIALRLAPAFGLRMTGMNSDGRAIAGFDQTVSSRGLDDALARCDYLVNTLPATTSTDAVLNKSTLARLRSSAVVINVGRANALDMDALCDALVQKRLAAAVVDVFPEEPVMMNSRFWHTTNLTMTAHVAALTGPQALAPQFLQNLTRFTAGQDLLGLVDFDKGY